MEDADTLVGRRIADKYEVLGRLGKGAMGVVYRVWHAGLECEQAMKVIQGEDAALRERFLREAKLASRIEHPHVVRVFDCGSHGGRPYYVMEMLHGESLGDTLARESRLSWSRARHIALQICDAVGETHAVGVTHRDLKPDNCYRITYQGDSDYIKLLDFGIAKVAGVSAYPTEHGALIGTVAYMAPEQTHGRGDHRVDVYAIGVILFQMLTGRLPFASDSQYRLLTAINQDQAPMLSACAPDAGIPEEVEALVARAMCKDPDGRPATATALYAALAAIPADAGGTEVTPPIRISPSPSARWTDSQVQAPTAIAVRTESSSAATIDPHAHAEPVRDNSPRSRAETVYGSKRASPSHVKQDEQGLVLREMLLSRGARPSRARAGRRLAASLGGLTCAACCAWIWWAFGSVDSSEAAVTDAVPAHRAQVQVLAASGSAGESSSAEVTIDGPHASQQRRGESAAPPIEPVKSVKAGRERRDTKVAKDGKATRDALLNEAIAQRKLASWSREHALDRRLGQCAIGVEWSFAGKVEFATDRLALTSDKPLAGQREICRAAIERAVRGLFPEPLKISEAFVVRLDVVFSK